MKRAGGGEAFLNHLGVGVDVVDRRFAGDAVDVQFRLEHGPQVVGLLRVGQKSVDKLCHYHVKNVFKFKTNSHNRSPYHCFYGPRITQTMNNE
jgi:hypothetical protein